MSFNASAVLIVDDSEGVCMAAAMMLEEDGFVVRTCHTLKEGRRLALDGDFRVILIDVLLGMDSGVELAQELVESNIDAKIILSSGLSDLGDELAAFPDLQELPILLKPFGRADLLSCVRKVINEAAA